MASSLFYAVRSRQLANQLRAVLGAQYDAKPVERTGTVQSATQVLVANQSYQLANAPDGIQPGGLIVVHNIGRAAAAVYAPASGGGSVIVGGGGGGGGYVVIPDDGGGGTVTPFNDDELVRRDGTHTLRSTADWDWETGARVAGALKAVGPGLVQVFGSLYAGRREGPHAGYFEYFTQDPDSGAIVKAYVSQVVDLENVPILSAGALDNGDPDDAWVNVGRENYPRIHWETVAGYDRKLPVVDAELLSGALNPDNLDLSLIAQHLPVPVLTSLDDLAQYDFQPGQLFQLKNGDSGALWHMTTWGPEPLAGLHTAGIHTHASEIEGGQIEHSSLGNIGANDHHDEVTLASSADRIFDLVGQQLDFHLPDGANQAPVSGVENDVYWAEVSLADHTHTVSLANIDTTGAENGETIVYYSSPRTTSWDTPQPAQHFHGITDLTDSGNAGEAIMSSGGDGVAFTAVALAGHDHSGVYAPIAGAHAAVTLDTNADTLLSLSTQALGLDTQAANRVLAGPATGDAAVPTFRALVAADMPAAYLKTSGADAGATAGPQTFTNGIITSVDGAGGQIRIQGGTNHDEYLVVGFDTTADRGVIDAIEDGAGYRMLVLTPTTYNGVMCGANSTGLPSKLMMTQDATSGASQFTIVGHTNEAHRLYLGFDTTNNYGWLQTITEGAAYRSFKINPNGGDVELGSSGGGLGFHGTAPIAQAVLATGASHNVDDVIAALQNLGLVKQS